MEPKFNLWIEQDGAVMLSAWRVRLLEAIDATGSITAAAEQMQVPYRRAWDKLKEMEQGPGVKLVNTAAGGAGGGAHLTDEGRAAMARFRHFAAGFDQQVAERYAVAFVATDGASPKTDEADAKLV